MIGTPTNTHIDMLRRAVDSDKKILLEKPIDLDLAKIDAAWAEIQPRAPFVMLGFCRRFDPSFREVRERVERGEIGTVRALRITSRDPQPPPAAYLGVVRRHVQGHDDPRLRHGPLPARRHRRGVQAIASDNGLDAFRQAERPRAGDRRRCGPPAAPSCTIVNSRSCAYGYDQRLEAFGDLGSLEAGNWTATTVRAATATQTEAAGPILNFFLERYMPAFQAELDEFVQAVIRRTARRPSGSPTAAPRSSSPRPPNESVATGRAVKVG